MPRTALIGIAIALNQQPIAPISSRYCSTSAAPGPIQISDISSCFRTQEAARRSITQIASPCQVQMPEGRHPSVSGETCGETVQRGKTSGAAPPPSLTEYGALTERLRRPDIQKKCLSPLAASASMWPSPRDSRRAIGESRAQIRFGLLTYSYSITDGSKARYRRALILSSVSCLNVSMCDDPPS